MARKTIQIEYDDITYVAKIVDVVGLGEENFHIETEVTGGELESATVYIQIPAGDYNEEELIVEVKDGLPSTVSRILREKRNRCLALKVADRVKL